MTAHKHAAMIKAKADNMELVVFEKDPSGWLMRISDIIHMNPSKEYFLCLPQHKEACLHWLNGGEVEKQTESTGKNNWCKIVEYGLTKGWHHSSEFMMINVSARIKPRKERRWIVVHPLSMNVEMFLDEKVCDNCMSEPMYNGYQKIEIEVEV